MNVSEKRLSLNADMEKDLSDLDSSNQHPHSLNLKQIPFLDQLISKLTAFSIETEGHGRLFNSINVESKSNAERGKKATEVFETNRDCVMMRPSP